MVSQLERYGFGAIVIDRRGYQDAASSILKDLEADGRKVIDDDGTGEFVAIRLHPAMNPVLPDAPPFPAEGFYGWEGDWRKGAHAWSFGNATLILTNPTKSPIEARYTFALNSLSKRRVAIITPAETLNVDLDPDRLATVGPISLRLAPGQTPIRFETDTSPTPSGTSGDSRRLAFAVALLPEPDQEPEPVLGTAFYGWEGDWRRGAHSWSRGEATLEILNSSSKTLERHYTFSLGTTSQRHVTVVTPSLTTTVELIPGKASTVGPFALKLEPGRTPIRFLTDKPPVLAGAGDPRTITFSLAIIPTAEAPPK